MPDTLLLDQTIGDNRSLQLAELAQVCMHDAEVIYLTRSGFVALFDYSLQFSRFVSFLRHIMQRNAFKHHRISPDVILGVVCRYCRFTLSCRDVRDLSTEHAIEVDASTTLLWLRKFGPEIPKRSFKHRSWRSLNCHMNETFIRVGSKLRYLWHNVDQYGQLVGFRLIARRNVKVARAFLNQACENAGLYQLRSIDTDEAHSNSSVVNEMSRIELPGEGILHINRKRENNRIESDHAALKKLITLMRHYNSPLLAKTLRGIEAIRAIKQGHIHGKGRGVRGGIRFVECWIGLVTRTAPTERYAATSPK